MESHHVQRELVKLTHVHPFPIVLFVLLQGMCFHWGGGFNRHCAGFSPQILGIDDVAARLKRPSTSPLCLSTRITFEVTDLLDFPQIQ